MKTVLVPDALEMAIWARSRHGATDLTGLIHHHEAGSQYTSIAFTERLAAAGVDASVGTVADAYDTALAESTIGLFKTELIKPRGPWKTATRSRSPPWNTSTGTTTAACTAAPRTCHQPTSKPCTNPANPAPPRQHPNPFSRYQTRGGSSVFRSRRVVASWGKGGGGSWALRIRHMNPLSSCEPLLSNNRARVSIRDACGQCLSLGQTLGQGERVFDAVEGA